MLLKHGCSFPHNVNQQRESTMCHKPNNQQKKNDLNHSKELIHYRHQCKQRTWIDGQQHNLEDYQPADAKT